MQSLKLQIHLSKYHADVECQKHYLFVRMISLCAYVSAWSVSKACLCGVCVCVCVAQSAQRVCVCVCVCMCVCMCVCCAKRAQRVTLLTSRSMRNVRVHSCQRETLMSLWVWVMKHLSVEVFFEPCMTIFRKNGGHVGFNFPCTEIPICWKNLTASYLIFHAAHVRAWGILGDLSMHAE